MIFHFKVTIIKYCKAVFNNTLMFNLKIVLKLIN